MQWETATRPRSPARRMAKSIILWATSLALRTGTSSSSQRVRPAAESVLAAMQVTQVFSVRLAILTLALPVFGLFSLVALVDGFVKRDLRRWGGGRESSFVYHWAKRSALPLLITSWVLYLALPFSLHPSFIVLPFATLFALSVTVTATTFKEYL